MSTHGSLDPQAPAPAEGRFLSGRPRAEVRRIHAGLLLFYLVDALLLTAYGWAGTLSPHTGWRYGLVGCALACVVLVWFWRRGGRVADLDVSTLAQVLVAAAVMFTTLGAAPQVGGMMLMSIMAVVALAAVQLTGGQLLALCLGLPVLGVAVMASARVGAGVPTSSPAECVLTALWLAWLLAKVAAHNVVGARLRGLVSEANARLAQALHDLERTASTDELTILPNRRAILDHLSQVLAGARQVDSGVGVAMMDIDDFKAINDRYGHDIGDQVLRAFGALASRGLRPSDRVGRYGGEEFLLVMQQMPDAAAAADAAERVRAGVAAHDWPAVAPGLAVTVSAGVALLERGEDAQAVIRRADAALYLAKRNGRNRVEASVAGRPPAVRVENAPDPTTP